MPFHAHGADGGSVTALKDAPSKPLSNTELEALADKGDAEAAHELGDRYDHGSHGLGKDSTKAAAWYQRASGLGHVAATADLAEFTLNGKGGIKPNDAIAFKLFLVAAGKQHPYATHMVGWMYELGRGVQKDDKEAATWYRKAAELGEVEALTELGRLTENGRGVVKDLEAAARMYAIAARGGSAQAMTFLGWFYVKGLGGLNPDYAIARQLFETASVLGNARADGNLGYLYEMGLGVTKNLSTALTKYKLSAEEGDLISQRYLGFIYETGQEVEVDSIQAFHYYRLAVDQNDPDALAGVFRLLLRYPTLSEVDTRPALDSLRRLNRQKFWRAGIALALAELRFPSNPEDHAEAENLLMEAAADPAHVELTVVIAKSIEAGRILPRDVIFGRRLFQEATEKGGPTGEILLAKTLTQGTSSEIKRGVGILKRLSDQGNAVALYELGLLYQNGQGVPGSSQKAMESFKASAAAGYAPAMYQLGLIYHLGIGIKKNAALAREWYRKAEALNYRPAKGRVLPDGTLVSPL
ncbi:HcpA family protein [Geothrix limicola]|uniref:HcpA family protein n=2 Tax=Geothrix limicola TaxID=2927978 RepID=A0ABQ5QIK3_9BACT|nr:HcpA family protein [Geothrix limicola]